MPLLPAVVLDTLPDPLHPLSTGVVWKALASSRNSSVFYAATDEGFFVIDLEGCPLDILGAINITELPAGDSDITLTPTGDVLFVRGSHVYNVTLGPDGITPIGLVEITTNSTTTSSPVTGAFCTPATAFATAVGSAHELIGLTAPFATAGSTTLSPATLASITGAATVPACGWYLGGGGSTTLPVVCPGFVQDHRRP